jgi:hypothetical protein
MVKSATVFGGTFVFFDFEGAEGAMVEVVGEGSLGWFRDERFV